jgi:hypothetical protein
MDHASQGFLLFLMKTKATMANITTITITRTSRPPPLFDDDDDDDEDAAAPVVTFPVATDGPFP